MVKFCLEDITRESNADSVVVTEWVICCHLNSYAQRAELGWGGTQTEGGRQDTPDVLHVTDHIHIDSLRYHIPDGRTAGGKWKGVKEFFPFFLFFFLKEGLLSWVG